jgi:hypothetical protein
MKRTLAVLAFAALGLAGCEQREPVAASGPYVVEGVVSDVGFDAFEVRTDEGLTAEMRWPARVPAVEESGREVHRAELPSGTPVRASYVLDEQGEAHLIELEVHPDAEAVPQEDVAPEQ